jgi:serine/threonine-protein kinase
MLPTSSDAPANSAEATRDLQDRLARFARMSFFISGALLVVSLAADLAAGSGGRGIAPWSRLVHLGALVALLVVWRVCRGRTLAVAVLENVDAALCLGMCLAWAALGFGDPPNVPIEPTVLLATTYTLIFRSVVVPSTFSRTWWISLGSVLPTLYLFFERRMSFVPSAAPETVRSFLMMSTVWCCVAVFTSALNSRQLYGLRQRIREYGRLGQYTLEEKIGEGGMGVVHRATHAMLRRPAAIKLLLPGRASERDLLRFEREVQLTSRLSHPNTISIFDYGRTSDGVFYYVMEFLDGFDLERVVESGGPLAPARAIHILAQAADALAEAHTLGLVHRDIKPANIILIERADAPDVVKVVDFGLVKTLVNAPGAAAVTQVDAVVGTPLCLAPEAITSPDSMDGRADLYALGAVGYFLLTGHPVFEARTVVEMCSRHLHDTPKRPSEWLGKPLSPDLEALILTCLAKQPNERPETAQALSAALRGCADARLYDVDAARAWWATVRPRVRTNPISAAALDPKATTMAIDLRGRVARQRAE